MVPGAELEVRSIGLAKKRDRFPCSFFDLSLAFVLSFFFLFSLKRSEHTRARAWVQGVKLCFLNSFSSDRERWNERANSNV